MRSKGFLLTKRLDKAMIRLYEVYRFILRYFRELFVSPFEWKEIIKQSYELGVRSLPLISLTGFIIGMVFTNQSRPSLQEFGASSWLPALISVAIIRALAPMITALIGSGRVASKIGAELGSMRVTEQIEALEVSAINPFKFLVVTRITATTLMFPFLTFYTAFVSLMGGFVNIYLNEGTSFTTFITQVFEAVAFLDFFSLVIKSTIYGFTIGAVGCFKGYNSSKGTEGVGRAANTAVVVAMLLIFVEELLLMQILNVFR
jgi:phospholipid/cholesterol/gamma-HCH transport system permease protein